MAKKNDVSGCQVIFTPKMLYSFDTSSESAVRRAFYGRADEVRRDLVRHLGEPGKIELRYVEEPKCEFCGREWTGDDANFNGCCETDAEAEDARRGTLSLAQLQESHDKSMAHARYWEKDADEWQSLISKAKAKAILDAASQGVTLKMDGNQWCATGADFINLQESPAGFGDTPGKAIEALREAMPA